MSYTHFPHGITSFGVPVGPNTQGLTGDAFFVTAADSATNKFRTWSEANLPHDKLFTTVADAYAACTTGRNDTVYVFPGNYTVTASLTWAKDQTHLVGLGGPNQRHCPTTATEGAVRVYCATSAVDNIFNITGNYVQIHGLQTMNTYSGNDNRCDFLISAKNTYMNNCRPRGGNGANQLNHADGGVPLIIASGTAGAGNAFTAENCLFGSAGNNARTVGAGAVLFEGGAVAGFAPIFRNCQFEMRCETSGSSDPKLIHLAADYAVDRLLLFDQCTFYNFYENLAAMPDYCIVDDCGSTHMIGLKDCFMYGFDYWCNLATYCFTNTADAVGYGGKSITITTG